MQAAQIQAQPVRMQRETLRLFRDRPAGSGLALSAAVAPRKQEVKSADLPHMMVPVRELVTGLVSMR